MSGLVRGLLWVVLSGLAFVLFIAVIRLVGSNLPATEAAFLRYLFSVLILIPVLLRYGVSILRTRHIGRYAVRGFVHAMGVMLWFYAITRMPIAEATALSYTAPIFVAIGAVLFLGERFTTYRAVAILTGFIGVLIILQPGVEVIGPGAWAILISAPLFAASKLLVKTLVHQDASITTVVYLSVFATLTMMLPALFVWVTPGWTDLVLLCIAAVFATASHYFLARGLTLVDVTVAQPAEFLQLVWSTLLGAALFAERPEIWVWVGAMVVVIGVSVITRLEARAVTE